MEHGIGIGIRVKDCQEDAPGDYTSFDGERERENMDKKFSGTFSLGLSSLQLQLQELFQDVGGSKTIQLLDALSQLPAEKHPLILEIFCAVLNRLQAEEQQACNTDEKAVNDFADSIYGEIMKSMHEAAVAPKFAVLDGGKSRSRSGNDPISLEEARKARKSGIRPVIN